MKILTRYLLRAHLGPFLFALSVLTSLLFVNTVARRFEELAGKGLPLSVILEVLALSLPHIIALTLPMAVLVAVLYAFSQLAAENEISALKASGVNLLSLMVPLLGAGVILGGFMVYFNDSILPETNHSLKNLLSDVARKSPTLELREQVVNEIRNDDLSSRYFLQAATIDPATSRMRDVTIYDLSMPAQPRIVYADSGRMGFSEDQTNLSLVLYNGWVTEVEEMQPSSFRRVFFDQQLLRVQGVNNLLERSRDNDYRSDREMSLGMLSAQADSARAQLDSVRAEAIRFSEIALSQVLAGPSQPAARGDGMHFPPPSTGYPTDPEFSGLRSDAALSDYVAERTAAQMSALASRAESLQRRVNEFEVEWHKKWAIPFACIVFVLIGAPLAVRFPRGGAGMVIMISLFIFAIYYMSLIGGESLGDSGRIDPAAGPWLPNIAFLLISIWGLARIGRESSTSRGGDFDDLVRTTKGFLTKPFRRRRSAKREALT